MKASTSFTNSLSGRFMMSGTLKRRRDDNKGGMRTKRRADDEEPTNNVFGATRPIDTFERLNRIGQGTYGTVYRAIDKRDNKMVALKKIILHNEKQDGFPITSLRELRLLKRVRHRNCVRLLEVAVGRARGEVFLVFEYCEHDLGRLLDSMRAPFTEAEVKGLAVQLFRAVEYLHDRWVVHRDLKMSNLLYDARGRVKLCDFGLARLYGRPEAPMTPKVVTLWYRPPELLLGAQAYTTAVDIWAGGCILGELLGHAPLVPGKAERDQLDRIFQLLGAPSERIWPGVRELPHVRSGALPLPPPGKHPYNNLPSRFPWLGKQGLALLNGMMTYDPAKRLKAGEVLDHGFFAEAPYPKEPHLLPTFPTLHDEEEGRPAGAGAGAR